MKILYVSSDQAGCWWYRCRLPAEQLGSQGGHTVVLSSNIAVAPSGEIGTRIDATRGERGFDLVVMQRLMKDRVADIIRRARSTGQAVINDVDDWFFGMPTSNAAFLGMHKRNDAETNVEHYRRALMASSAITVSTPYLAKRLESLGRPVFVLRNLIDLKRWTPAVVASGPPTLGWFGFTDFRAAGDLAQLSGVVAPWLRRHPEARFLHIGSSGEADRARLQAVLGIDPERLLTRPACHISELHLKLTGMDVGLAPLEDCPFNQAKSWIKALEFGAAGVPCIASDMAEYRAFAAAPLAKRPRDWTAALDRLSDQDERLRTATQARARARELDIAKGWRAWEVAYMKTVSDAMASAIDWSAEPLTRSEVSRTL